MPAKVTMFNLKGDDIFDFGTGPRNEAHFDPFGKDKFIYLSLISAVDAVSLAAVGPECTLCGFGNLRGQIQFWGKEDSGARSHLSFKRVCEYKAEDTTLFRWCPDGIHILTATTSPRLRVHNGFKNLEQRFLTGWTIWKYDGTKVAQFSYPANEELWDVIWMPQPQISEQPLQIGLPSSAGEKCGGNKESAAYVPPHMRGMANKPSFKLHEFEPASSEKNNYAQDEANLSKNAIKNRKKLENKRAKKEAALVSGASAATFNKNQNNPAPSNYPPSNHTRETVIVNLQSPAEVEKAKKIKQISKKLEQIMTYKQRLAKGEALELNQLDKIKNETDLREELEALQL
uniref:Translation initiation factor beta propellor-like domain-containing protein n=1 Tax=Romanomermis culicivorax TaxID=13658 RepID=A0A915KLF0_ROMCU